MIVALFFLGLDVALSVVSAHAVYQQWNVALALVVGVWCLAMTVFHMDVITRERA